MSISKIHQAALDFAARGVPVFPCLAGSKEPATDKGFHDATTDVDQINAWWEHNPEFNLAFQPQKAGWAVIDPDGEEGIRAWEDLVDANGGAPETYTVRTPRGGLHEYYLGDLPPSVNKLGHHIDTRGGGSYVLVPPSVIDKRSGKPESHWGSYKVEVDVPPSPLPAWVPEILERLKRDKAKATVEDLDLPGNVTRAIAFLRGRPPVIQGEGADAKTYEYACDVLNLGVSPEKCLEIMLEHYNCQPQDDRFEAFLERKIENASQYAQNEPGAWAVEPAGVVFADALDKLALDDPEPARPNRFKGWSMAELSKLPPPSWLLPGMLPAKGVSLFYGPGGSYKTFLVLDIAMDLAAAGKRVVYIAGEGKIGTYQRQLAWCALNNVEALSEDVFQVVPNMPWASDGEMLAEFIEAWRAWSPDLVIVDTAARMLTTLNENDAKDMGMLVAALDTIKEQLGAAVAVIHHTGKDVSKGARGSDALLYATDAAFEVIAHDATKAAAIYCRRMKESAKPDKPWTYEGYEIAASLAFKPISLSEHKALTQVDDALAAKKIGAALLEMNAKGIENGVTTHVLAHHLLPRDDEMSDEAAEIYTGRIAKVLAQRAGGSLEAYASGKGSDMRWNLPG